MNDLDAINMKIDLVDWAEKAGSRLKKSGSEWRGTCPIHGGDNPNGFAIYENGRRWTCFTGDCGSGDALGFIMKLRRIGLLEAIDIVTGGKPLPPEEVAQLQHEHAERVARELQEKIDAAQQALKEIRETQIWLKYHEQLMASDVGKIWWDRRGVPDFWQQYWQLGYETDRRIWIGRELHTPTATIPVFDGEWQVKNIKHRLIDADSEAGKYRYEYSNLGAPVYLCDPDKPTQNTVVVVEGEIKAMVTYITMDNPNWQVIGIPGKNTPIDAIKQYTADASDVFICCDPDTGKMNEGLAHELGAGRCRIVETPVKIDDYILACGIGKDKLKTLFNQSRRIR